MIVTALLPRMIATPITTVIITKLIAITLRINASDTRKLENNNNSGYAGIAIRTFFKHDDQK